MLRRGLDGVNCFGHLLHLPSEAPHFSHQGGNCVSLVRIGGVVLVLPAPS